MGIIDQTGDRLNSKEELNKCDTCQRTRFYKKMSRQVSEGKPCRSLVVSNRQDPEARVFSPQSQSFILYPVLWLLVGQRWL